MGNGKIDVKVSVIIAVYNTAPYLRQCLESIREQTLKEIEVICVDDGSTDESWEILKEYERLDSRFRILRQQHTGKGAANARNAGMKIARGKWLSILDSDDYFDLELLEKVYSRGEELDADIVMYDAWRLDDATGDFFGLKDVLNPDILPEKEVFNRADISDDIFSITIGAAWSLLLNHRFVSENHLAFQPVYHADDLFFTYSAIALAERITAVRERLLYYRFNIKTSQTANKTSNPLSAPMAWDRLGQWLKEKDLFDLLAIGYYNRAAYYCKWYLDTVQSPDSHEVLYEALQKEWLDKLGLSRCSREIFHNKGYYEWCRRVRNMPYQEYLFYEGYERRHAPRKKGSFQYQTDHLFPRELVSKEEKVVLYGAGNVGRAWFIQNLLQKHCNIVAWVDANFQHMPIWVESPELIKNCKFDKLLIGIEDPRIAEEVRRELEEKGVARQKICWKAPILQEGIEEND